MREPFAVGGAGAPEILLSKSLSKFALEHDGRIQLAIEAFAKAMEIIKPKMEEIEKKYPNLKGTFKGDAIPDEFKEFEGRIKEMGPKFAALMGKMMQYMGDPKFQEVQKKLQESMK